MVSAYSICLSQWYRICKTKTCITSKNALGRWTWRAKLSVNMLMVNSCACSGSFKKQGRFGSALLMHGRCMIIVICIRKVRKRHYTLWSTSIYETFHCRNGDTNTLFWFTALTHIGFIVKLMKLLWCFCLVSSEPAGPTVIDCKKRLKQRSGKGWL